MNLISEMPSEEEISNGDARDKLITARVRLQKDQPFFSYLTMALRLVEDKTLGTAAVDSKGNLYYNPDFVNHLTKDQTKTLLAHEAMHVALLHLTRVGPRKHEAWNVAIDIITNNLLVNNDFDFSGLLRAGLVPKDNEYTIAGVKIKELDKKFVEEIYEIVEKLVVEDDLTFSIDSKGNIFATDSKGKKWQLDKHIHGKPKEDETKEEREEREKVEQQWKKRLAEAYTYAKNQGREPAGLERHMEDLLSSKMDWRQLLHRFISREINFDYSYSRPSKRSIATGQYMPSIVKDDTLNVTVAIDTSGSIGGSELNEFISEVYAIGKSFSQVKMNLIFWDTEAHEQYEIDTTSLDDLLAVEVSGGGGTDFTNLYEHISENLPQTKVLIFFTDGFADYPDEEKYKTLWVLSKQSCDESAVPFGEVIKIE